MNEALWTRVQTALDQRRDPLEDPALREWLHEHPHDALALGDLRAALGELEMADNPRCAPRRLRMAPLATAAGLVVVALGARLAIPSRTAAEDLELHPIVAAPALGSIRSWSVVSTSESPEGTQTVRASEGRISFDAEFSLQASSENCVLAMRTEGWIQR